MPPHLPEGLRDLLQVLQRVHGGDAGQLGGHGLQPQSELGHDPQERACSIGSITASPVWLLRPSGVLGRLLGRLHAHMQALALRCCVRE